LAGVISYDPIDWENRTTALGYWLGEQHQSNELVTAACRALVEHAFWELSLNRVVIYFMAGHGAQKLFGSFGGPGLEGTSGFMEMLGMRPGRPWAYLAGLSEFGGGVLTALGLLYPMGPSGS
jgi:uncharacterized membrane protein YphA (DoxX/SURF4 family)